MSHVWPSVFTCFRHLGINSPCPPTILILGFACDALDMKFPTHGRACACIRAGWACTGGIPAVVGMNRVIIAGSKDDDAREALAWAVAWLKRGYAWW